MSAILKFYRTRNFNPHPVNYENFPNEKITHFYNFTISFKKIEKEIRK